jgi:FMN-dependent NADH-azoreductase
MLVVYARGGEYPPDSEAEALDLQIRYIELIFGFIGFKDIRSVVVEPTLQGGPDVAGVKRQGAIEEVKEIAEDF